MSSADLDVMQLELSHIAIGNVQVKKHVLSA